MSEYLKKGLRKVLILNSVRCLCCDEILVSTHRHHYVSCDCPNGTFTDGGCDFTRGGGVDLDKVEDLSQYVIMTEQEYQHMLERKRIKDEEILQKKIESGEMIKFGGKWIDKSTWKLIMDNCLNLGVKYW